MTNELIANDNMHTAHQLGWSTTVFNCSFVRSLWLQWHSLRVSPEIQSFNDNRQIYTYLKLTDQLMQVITTMQLHQQKSHNTYHHGMADSKDLDDTHPGTTEECRKSRRLWSKLWNPENRRQQQRVQLCRRWPESLWTVGSCVNRRSCWAICSDDQSSQCTCCMNCNVSTPATFSTLKHALHFFSLSILNF